MESIILKYLLENDERLDCFSIFALSTTKKGETSNRK